MKTKLPIGLLAAAFIAPLLTTGTAHAIPAFARQHKAECSTCHTIFPELNETGENFRKNSYVLVTAKEGAGAAQKDTAKDNRTAGREHLILASLPDYVPLSVSGTFNASYDDSGTGDAGKFDFVTRAIRLQAGGSFNDLMGVYLTYNLYTNQTAFDNTLSNAPGNNIPNVEEAFAQVRHIFATPANLKLGRFMPSLSLWKRNNKTAVSDYATTTYTVGQSVFSTSAPADGMELNSILAGRLFLAGGAIKRMDQKTLEGYGSVQYKIGGADFNGAEADIDLEGASTAESIMDYLAVTVGGYGYAGNNNVGNNKQLNNYYRYGFESDIRYKRARLKLASAFGKDDNSVVDPTGTTPQGLGIELKSRVFSGEALYLIGSNVIPSFRYEYIDNGQAITHNYIPTIAYAALQNAKIVVECKVQEQKTETNTIYNVAFVGAF